MEDFEETLGVLASVSSCAVKQCPVSETPDWALAFLCEINFVF